MLKDAGIAVILDHHALPGVQSADQMFAGRCTKDVQFFVRAAFSIIQGGSYSFLSRLTTTTVVRWSGQLS